MKAYHTFMFLFFGIAGVAAIIVGAVRGDLSIIAFGMAQCAWSGVHEIRLDMLP